MVKLYKINGSSELLFYKVSKSKKIPINNKILKKTAALNTRPTIPSAPVTHELILTGCVLVVTNCILL